MGTDTRHDDSIGRLCIALAHLWEPERLFVIFTAYFDESGTHKAAPTLVLSAFLGHAYQWRRFETKLDRIRKRYSFQTFHAKDFKARAGEFRGWSSDKSRDLIRDLTVLVRDNLVEGLTTSLPHERYMQEYRGGDVPKGMRLDSQYGVCFRMCLGRILLRLEARGNRDQLHVVMEGGHKNVGDCDRIFHEFKQRWEKLGHPIFGTFSTAGKECVPLMVADMLAFGHNRALEEASMASRMANYVIPNPGQRNGVLAFLELQSGALEGLKSGFEELRQLEHAERQAARDARKAASGGSE